MSAAPQASTPPSPSPSALDRLHRIGVIGAGQMGGGIAHVCALAGFDVVMTDIGDDALQRGLTAIDRNLVSRLDHAAYLGRELARRTRSRHRAALRAGRSTGTRSQHALWLHGVILRTGCCRYRHSGPA